MSKLLCSYASAANGDAVSVKNVSDIWLAYCSATASASSGSNPLAFSQSSKINALGARRPIQPRDLVAADQ